MKNNKRPPKRVKTFRFAPVTLTTLARVRELTGWSESFVIEIALAHYYMDHPEYWRAVAAATEKTEADE